MLDIPTYDLTIPVGVTFSLRFTIEDEKGQAIDLTGATFAMQVRSTFASQNALLSASTASGIVVAANVVTVTLSASATGEITDDTGVYDLFLTWSTGRVDKLFKGKVTFEPRATR